jgi:hypothetical protein
MSEANTDTLDKAELNDVKEYALSNDDIQRILEPDTKIFAYPKFAEMKHIDEAFDPLGRCIFLFLTKSPTSGHWLTMFKRDGHIEYFDSYGEKPEEQREWITQEMLDELGEGQPYLMDLLKRSRVKVYYNTYAYQKDKDDINTCGRWAVARLMCMDMSNLQFYNLVKGSGKTPDDWVSLFTYEILGK